jgi:chromosome segregation ATPase
MEEMRSKLESSGKTNSEVEETRSKLETQAAAMNQSESEAKETWSKLESQGEALVQSEAEVALIIKKFLFSPEWAVVSTCSRFEEANFFAALARVGGGLY